ncbi:MAG: HNH endonuclease [Elusimicrobia bacterium]|nr:HNH endonuclease [Elusimicrobiota bacterium]
MLCRGGRVMPTAPGKHRQVTRRPVAAAPRATAHQRGYTRRWSAYSKHRLRQHPLCERCGGLANVTDHIEPHDGEDDPRFWDTRNHQSLCKRCHDTKTATEDRGFGRRATAKQVRRAAGDDEEEYTFV